MTVNVRNLDIYYEQAGQGPEVVLLHGWGYDCTLLRPLFEYLAQTHRVTMLDFPGHGRSPEPLGVYTVYDFAALTAELLEALQIEKAVLLGHSFGCRVAIILGAQKPELVSKLVLCGAAGIKPKRSAGYYYRIYSYKAMKKILSLPVFSEGTAEEYGKNKGSEDYRKLSGTMKQTFSRVVNEDLTPLLPRIQASTLLLWGERDTATPLYMARKMEELIPDCGLVIYPGMGHYAFLEGLPRTCRILDSFLGGKA